MARIFLYIIAAVIVLVIAGFIALRVFADDLTRVALVPTTQFVEQEALAGNVYDDPTMWFARPGKPAENNPALWLPTPPEPAAETAPAGVGAEANPAAPVPAAPAEPAAEAPLPEHAVFFIHPTSYLGRDYWNVPLTDSESQERARLFLRGMASVFNASADIWAPRYRQAAFGAFLTEKPEGALALDAAYRDVEQAFGAFVKALPAGRPVVLAGHSQGALHLTRLLRERVAGTPFAERVIAAYIVGWPVSVAHDLPMLGLPACDGPDASGCILSWQSYGPDNDPSMVTAAYDRTTGFNGESRAGSPMLCTNPLTGGAAPDAPASANLGTLSPNDDLTDATLVPGAVGAACDARGLLILSDDADLGPYVLPGGNYHVYDYPLFWQNVRADVARRVRAFAARQ